MPEEGEALVLADDGAPAAGEGEVFVLALASSLPRLPPPMRALCAAIQSGGAKLGLPAEQRTALVGGYLVLRFFNPAIVAPDAHGLLAEPPSAPARWDGLSCRAPAASRRAACSAWPLRAPSTCSYERARGTVPVSCGVAPLTT